MLIAGGIGLVAGGVVGGYQAWRSGGNIWVGAGRGAVIGGVAGVTGAWVAGLVGGGGGVLAAIGAGGLSGAASDAAGQGVGMALGWQHAYNPAQTATAFGLGAATGGIGAGIRGLCPTGSTSASFTSPDPHVADLANRIEARYPGLVKGVNVNVGGHEVDILLDNAVVEVKNSPKGLTSQIRARNSLGLPVVGYSPNMGPHAARSINAAGGIAAGGSASTLDELLDILAP